MKRITVLLLFFLFTFGGASVHAQSRENIESAKVAYLTDKMALTPEQSQKFWPVYKEYESKRREIMHARLHKGQELEKLNDQELKAMVDNMFERRQKELNLEQEYSARYQRILSPKQLVLFYRGEHEFTKLLLKRLDATAGKNN